MANLSAGTDGSGGERGLRASGQASEKLPQHASAKTAGKHASKHVSKKHAAKKHAGKHAARKEAAKHAGKHAAKKHAAKKHAAKHAGASAFSQEAVGSAATILEMHPAASADEGDAASLNAAYHHLQRAGAVISLLEKESGGDLRGLLEHGITLYRNAYRRKPAPATVQCALGLLKAAEHLGMAGLYAARREHRVDVTAPSRDEVLQHLEELEPRLDRLKPPRRAEGQRLEAMARELLRRGEAAGDDPHLEYELTMAADGICTALEAGL